MDEKKLATIFSNVLEIPLGEINDEITYNVSKNWDSLAHMVIVAAIDEAFDIMLEMTDIVDMSSFAKAKEIVNKCLLEKSGSNR